MEVLGTQLQRMSQQERKTPPAVIREVRTETVARADLPEAAIPAASTPPVVSELTAEEKDRHMLEFNQARLALCEEAFHEEDAAPGWSESAAQKLREVYTNSEFKALRVGVECRATLCRVDLSYDPEVAADAVHGATYASAWSGRRFSRVDLEKSEATIYVAREGYDIPEPDGLRLDEGFAPIADDGT
jgi:hypothetical protein